MIINQKVIKPTQIGQLWTSEIAQQCLEYQPDINKITCTFGLNRSNS